MDNITNNYVLALRKKYEANILEAKANLSLYLSSKNMSAIGEHSDLMAEQDKWIDILSTNTGKLETLESIYDSTNMRVKL